MRILLFITLGLYTLGAVAEQGVHTWFDRISAEVIWETTTYLAQLLLMTPW